MRLSPCIETRFLGLQVSLLLFSLALPMTAAMSQFSYSALQTGNTECLSGNDPENLAANPHIKRAIAALGLERESIVFAGCEGGRFKTDDVSPVSSEHEFKISYPTFPDFKLDSTSSNQISPYVAPITHELSHVFQIKRSGSIEALKEKNKIIEIELAADFISGVVFAKTQNIANINAYQQSLALVGLYQESMDDAHGTWAQRVTAFRYGAFYDSSKSLLEAEAKFRKSLLNDVLALAAPRKGREPSPKIALAMDKLSACADMTNLHSKLTSASTPFLGGCRKPSTELERIYGRAHSKFYGEPPCLLNQSPVPILDEFSCFQSAGGSRGITCIRPSAARVVTDHFSDRYVAQEAAYMAQASACGDNADSSLALPSLFSQNLAIISEFEFGYVRSLGKKSPIGSQAQHGFATLDPAIKNRGTGTIEYLTMFVNLAPYAGRGGRTERKGAWIVEIDESVEFNVALKKSIKQATNLDVYIQTASIRIRRDPESVTQPTSKDQLLKSWQRLIIQELRMEGFVLASQKKSKDVFGEDFEILSDQLMETVPYGFRSRAPRQKIDINTMSNIERPACTEKNGGGVGIAIGLSSNNPPAPEDYGSIMFLLMGLGECAKLSSQTITYISGIREDAFDSVLSSLEKIK